MAEPTCAVDRSPCGLTRSSATVASNCMAIPASEKPDPVVQTYGGSVTDELCQRPESLLPVSPRRFGYPGRKRVDDRAALPCRNVPGVSQCSAGISSRPGSVR